MPRLVPAVAFAAFIVTAAQGWNLADLHLFIDTDGLQETTGLVLKQHQPHKTYRMAVVPSKPWDGGGPLRGGIEGYSSVVQVSVNEVRIYYDTFGVFGRFLCVAVSTDAGLTFSKPSLGLVEFNGSTASKPQKKNYK